MAGPSPLTGLGRVGGRYLIYSPHGGATGGEGQTWGVGGRGWGGAGVEGGEVVEGWKVVGVVARPSPAPWQLPCAGATEAPAAANGSGNGRNGAAPQAFVLAGPHASKALGALGAFNRPPGHHSSHNL